MLASVASSSSAAGSRFQARDAGFLTLPEAPLSADEAKGKGEHGGFQQNCWQIAFLLVSYVLDHVFVFEIFGIVN